MSADPTCGVGMPKNVCGQPARSMVFMETHPVNDPIRGDEPHVGIAYLCPDHDYASRRPNTVYRGGNPTDGV